MEIPKNSYTFETFLDYILQNKDKVFIEKNEKKWLKIYIIYAIRDWKKLFENFETDSFGEILKIYFYDESSDEKKIVFYGYEISSGILLMFTSSTKENYEKTLKKFILTKKGISQSWIKPSLLDKIRYHLINNYDANVYRFIGRRYKNWKFDSKIRPDTDRRISYSGSDANETLKELQSLYGIIPSSIDMTIDNNKIQVNRNGLFIVRQINKKTIGFIYEILDIIISEQQRIRDLSEKLNIRPNILDSRFGKIKISQVTSGKIMFSKNNLSESFVENLFDSLKIDHFLNAQLDNDDEANERVFSFIDTDIQRKPLTFKAIVIDENKKSIFGISGNENEIILIPKHRVTFESFINFYNYVTENIDDNANLMKFGEVVAS